MTKLNQEHIDNYHSGRMSESEMADFEKMINSDPAIKAESEFQSDIVNGLKEFRKLELKSRLDAINVGPTWFEFAQQSALMKSLGGVIVASVIGTGIYMYGERSEVIDENYPVTVESPEIDTPDTEYVLSLGQEDIAEEKQELKRPPVKEEVSAKEIAEAARPQVSEMKTEAAKEEVFKPSFEAPDVESVEEDGSVANTGLDEIPEATTVSTSESPIDVQTEISKSSTIKYKYYDGKLYLNGDFDKAPYEILEINSASGRRIYVYYLGSYYKVGLADKLTELPQVKDQQVINELKLLRENK